MGRTKKVKSGHDLKRKKKPTISKNKKSKKFFEGAKYLQQTKLRRAKRAVVDDWNIERRELKKHAKQFHLELENQQKYKEQHEKNIKIVQNGKLVDETLVMQAVGAMRKLKENGKIKKPVMDITEDEDDDPVMMQVTLCKLPKPTKNQNLLLSNIIKVNLPNNLLKPSTDVLLIVKDKAGGPEKTIQYFTDVLRSHKLNRKVTEIMTLSQLRVDHKEYEAKRNLANRTDVVLCDVRIIKLVPRCLGKHFYNKKKFPLKVNLGAKKLSVEFSRALRKTHLVFAGGNCALMKVGHLNQTDEQISQNIHSAVRKLAFQAPGGWANIQNMSLKLLTSTSVPFYVNLNPMNNVETIYPKPKTEKKQEDVISGTITTQPSKTVQIYPDGNVFVKIKKGRTIKREASRAALEQKKHKYAMKTEKKKQNEKEKQSQEGDNQLQSDTIKSQKTQEGAKKKGKANTGEVTDKRKQKETKKKGKVDTDEAADSDNEDEVTSLEQAYLKRLRKKQEEEIKKQPQEVDAWAESESDSSDSDVE